MSLAHLERIVEPVSQPLMPIRPHFPLFNLCSYYLRLLPISKPSTAFRFSTMSWMDSWSRPKKHAATPPPLYLTAGEDTVLYCHSCGRVISRRSISVSCVLKSSLVTCCLSAISLTTRTHFLARGTLQLPCCISCMTNNRAVSSTQKVPCISATKHPRQILLFQMPNPKTEPRRPPHRRRLRPAPQRRRPNHHLQRPRLNRPTTHIQAIQAGQEDRQRRPPSHRRLHRCRRGCLRLKT